MQRCVFIMYSITVLKMALYVGLDVVKIDFSGVIGVSYSGPVLGNLLQMLIFLADEQFVEGEIEIMDILDK